MNTIEKITNRVTLVVLDIRIWSARKKLKAEDLNLGTGEIPPEDLVSLGSKRVCDPDLLKPFSRLKQNAERVCLNVGTRFLGGFAIPNAEVASVAATLYRLKAEFDNESGDFLREYDLALEKWISSLPEFEAPIRRAIEPVNIVGGKLHFGFQLIAVSPAEHSGTLVEEVQGLGNGIFAEVSQMAKELESSFEGKDKLHRRALSTFGRIREKLACLSFIDARIQPVVDTIDDWLGRLPKTAPISGGIFNEGMGLAMLLADPSHLARHGGGQMAVRNGTAPIESEDDPVAILPEELDFEAEGFAPPLQVPGTTSEPVVQSFFF